MIRVPIPPNDLEPPSPLLERSPHPMTVGELIEALSKFPADLPVQTEGCDCFGDAVEVGYGTRNPAGKPCEVIDRRAVVIARDAGWVEKTP